MPDPEPVSRWPGRARLTALSLGIALAIAGCATRPPANTRSVDDLEFFERAMDGSASLREAMWRETAAAGRNNPDAALRLALLQSIPDHSSYDPAAAQHNLRALLAQNPPEHVAALARVRLSELRSSNQCLSETQELKRRLSQVVDIERQIDFKRQ
ncbi:MAG: hypothetical protein JWR07_590 [Nevskia sp.]|nr:hypothetical protein [Nevskia sp.]